MFGYTIALTTDAEKFYEVCDHIETNLGLIGIKKEALLEDVDGTLIQGYDFLNQKIKVLNDYEVDAVYVDSEVDLSTILKNYIIYTSEKEV